MTWYGYVETTQTAVVTFEANFQPRDGYANPPPNMLDGTPVPLRAVTATTVNGATTFVVDNAKLLSVLGPVQYIALWNK